MARPLSVSTALFDGYPLERAIDEIASAGARAIEPAYIRGYVDFDEDAFSDGNAVRLRRLIEQAGLPAQALSAHLDLGERGAPAALARRIRFAAGVGAPILITNAGGRDRRATVLRVIAGALPLLEDAGLTLALENPGHGSGALIGKAADGLALIDSLGSPRVRLNYDIGNTFTYSRENLCPLEDMRAALPVSAHLHAKDILSRPDGWWFTAIGDGSVGYGPVRERLDRLAPDLPVGIELPLRLMRPGRGDPVRAPEPLPLPVLRRALARSLAAWGRGPDQDGRRSGVTALLSAEAR